MFASKTNLIATLATAAGLLMATAAIAKNSNGTPPPRTNSGNKDVKTISTKSLGLTHVGQLSGNSSGKFKITHGGNPPHSPDSFKWNKKYWYCDHSHHIVFCDHFVEPVFANYVVVPGDTLELISLKLFRTSNHSLFLASLNRVPVNALLIPGQVLIVPAF
jgi:LysM domain-containing protein